MLGLKESPAPLAISGLCDFAWDISDEVMTLSELVHPTQQKVRELIHKENLVDRGMATS
jgi:hypothetical protein